MENFKEIEAKALTGNYSAMSELANYYIQGNVVEKNIEEGINWYEKAIKAGDDFAPQTVNDIGYNLQVGQNGYEVNLSLALRCYKIAADAGNVLGMSNYAYCNYCGTGTEKNYQAAYEYWQKAADKGDAVCMNNVGFCYEYGYGVELDLTKAIDYYFMALDNKYQNAETTIKTFCENHKGEIFSERHLEYLVNNNLITEICNLPANISKLPKLRNSEKLTTIILPDTIVEIPEGAFEECRMLRKVVLSKTITKIPNRSFFHCVSLIDLYIPEGIQSIGECAFLGCSSLIEMSIPNSVKLIGTRAFQYCSALSNVLLPTSIKVLPEDAFSDCKSLKEIAIPSSIVEIQSGVFSGCSSLTTAQLSNCIAKVGDRVFDKCASLRDVTLSNAMDRIPFAMFRNCSSLKGLELPYSIREIGVQAFSGCVSLHTINIPNSVSKILRAAFDGCKSLTCLNIPDSVNTIEKGALEGCISIENLTIPFIGGSSDTNGNDDILSYIFGYEMVTLGDLQIEEKNNKLIPVSLQHVTINGSNIPNDAFNGCSNIKSISLGSSVNKIEDYAFYNCRSLGSITMHDSVRSVGTWAFADCSSLQNIKLSEQLTELPSNVFNGCSQLDNIVIPRNIISINDNAFKDCSNLKAILFLNNDIEISRNAFEGCNNLESDPYSHNEEKTIEEKAESGDSKAACQLGMWYQYGQNGYDKDTEKAIYWYQMGAMNGSQTALDFMNALIKEKNDDKVNHTSEEKLQAEDSLMYREMPEKKRVTAYFHYYCGDNTHETYFDNEIEMYEEEYYALLKAGPDYHASYVRRMFGRQTWDYIRDVTIRI